MLRNVSRRGTPKTKNRLNGVSISRNVSQSFSKNGLIYIPDSGGQLRPKYPFIDVKELKEDDLIIDSNGEKWIRKKRQKTKNWANIPLLPAAQKILDKYVDDAECLIHKTLLPVPSNQKMNAYLKEIADLCGLNMILTTHVARHTFATTVTLSNNVSIEAVSKMLGHSSLAMTKKYARILDHYIADEFGKIRDKY
jgi:integrase